MKHPHHDMIVAWLNNEIIEESVTNGKTWNVLPKVEDGAMWLPRFDRRALYRRAPDILHKYLVKNVLTGECFLTEDYYKSGEDVANAINKTKTRAVYDVVRAIPETKMVKH